jgi:hypothetical protein
MFRGRSGATPLRQRQRPTARKVLVVATDVALYDGGRAGETPFAFAQDKPALRGMCCSLRWLRVESAETSPQKGVPP